MKLQTILLSFTLGLFSIAAVAGGGHDHGHGHSHSNTPVDSKTATTNATKVVAAFVKRKSLDASWSAVVASSVEKKVFKGNPEWLVIFVNEKITNPAEKKLYVFLTLGGDYIAANYSGK